MPTKRLSVAERLARHTQKLPSGCWEWTGFCDPSGYGRINVEKRPLMAHRVSYELNVGPVPDGLCVLHRCDNPPCVNPAHLFCGTRTENASDRHGKGRTSKGAAVGSARLTETTVRELRQLRDADPKTWTFKALGERYGITAAAAFLIHKRRNWRHVT